MKLANPRNIQINIAEERRADIDNGVKLARKVDSLRTELSELEHRKELYNNGTTLNLQEKVKGLKEEISAKEFLIEELERKRNKLLEPLIIKWDEVNTKERELIIESENLEILRNNLTLYKTELDNREKELSLGEERMYELKKEISTQSDKVAQSSLQAQNTLLDARELERKTLSHLKEKTKEITNKEKKVLLRESNVKERENQLEKEEQNIINEKIRLADQRATLERAMKRLN